MKNSSFWSRFIGNCWTAQIKDGIPFNNLPIPNTEVNSNSTSRDVNDCHGSGKTSFSSIPPTPRSEDDILQSTNVKRFTFSELKNVTRNFRPDSVLGEGGFGSVFKGWIDEHTFAATKPGTGMIVAVKKLKLKSFQGHREWLAEVNYLGCLLHPNLVKLIGFCWEDEHRLLVYEFMPRGSLENHLFRRGFNSQTLSWYLRMKVALGAAKGLAFLHGHEPKVIYRDLKTSNILLDSDYTAKLSDFGLAKDGPSGDKSHVSTRVMGTYGYAAPEYLSTGHLTEKSDIYSFGVVLLELLSGQRAVDKNRPHGQHNLVELGKPCLMNKRKVFSILDSRLGNQYSVSGVIKLAALTLRCLSNDAKSRPDMEHVVTILEQLQEDREQPQMPLQDSYSKKETPSKVGHKFCRKRSKEDKCTREVSQHTPSASPLYAH